MILLCLLSKIVNILVFFKTIDFNQFVFHFYVLANDISLNILKNYKKKFTEDKNTALKGIVCQVLHLGPTFYFN